jgi:hypothetical protein
MVQQPKAATVEPPSVPSCSNGSCVGLRQLAETEQLRAAGVQFRNDIVTGPGGSQVLLKDPMVLASTRRTLP